jgi:flagellar hook-associated protein 3 FlgL
MRSRSWSAPPRAWPAATPGDDFPLGEQFGGVHRPGRQQQRQRDHSGPTITDTQNANYGTGFSLTFSTAADGTAQYSLDGADPVAYTSGDTLEVNGLSLTLSGTPVDGDTREQSRRRQPGRVRHPEKPDLGAANPGGNRRRPSQPEQHPGHRQSPTEQRPGQRAHGTDLSGLATQPTDVLDTIGDDLALSYTERLSGLVDADYTESVSEYTALQVALQAAQQTFVSIQKMSLFEYI